MGKRDIEVARTRNPPMGRTRGRCHKWLAYWRLRQCGRRGGTSGPSGRGVPPMRSGTAQIASHDPGLHGAVRASRAKRGRPSQCHVTAVSTPSTPSAPKSPPGRRPETEFEPRSPGGSPQTTHASSSSACIRRLICDMTPVVLAGSFALSAWRVWLQPLYRPKRWGKLPEWPASVEDEAGPLVIGEVHHPTVSRESERAVLAREIPEKGVPHHHAHRGLRRSVTHRQRPDSSRSARGATRRFRPRPSPRRVRPQGAWSSESEAAGNRGFWVNGVGTPEW